MKIGIVTDSTCDLPVETLAQHPVLCVHADVLVHDKVYKDWLDIHPVEIYQMMLTEEPSAFSTSPGEIEKYVDVYREALEKYDHVIAIHVSSKLSKMFEQAKIAVTALKANERVTFVDSTYAHSASAALVLGASQMIAQGRDLAVVIEEVHRIRDELLYLFAPKTFKWLVAYGRVPNVTALFANLLGLRPVLTIKNGMIDRYARARTGAVLSKFVSELEKKFGSEPIILTFSIGGMVPKLLTEFENLLAKSTLNVAQARLQMVGPSVGIIMGPGGMAVTAYPVAKSK